MTSIPHAYRRGAIYWYRRVLYLFQDRKIVVRLSLRTAEPSQARQRSSALGGATAGIKVMIENQFKHARNLGTNDLEAIGKQAYEEKLAGIQTAERLDPTNVDAVLRPVWLALHDLSQLVIQNGGRAVEVDQCGGSLRREAGFDDVRLTNLCNVADLTANGDGILNEHQIDPLIKDRGFAVNERNRRAARLASLPHVAEAYRVGAIGVWGDAVLPAPKHQPELKTEQAAAISTGSIPVCSLPTAPATLKEVAPAPAFAHPATQTSTQASEPVPAYASSRPWSSTTTLTQAAEWCIETRISGNVWGGDSVTQVRTAVQIFVFVNGDLRVSDIGQRHVGAMFDLFPRMPKSWGRTKEELERGLAATMERAQTMSADKIGLHVKTQRKHFSWIHAVLDYATANGVRPAESVTTRALTKGRDTTPEHEKRFAWDKGELVILLRVAIWTGSQSLKQRLKAGSMIWHDGGYFIPLILPLMGPRVAEAAGLSLTEVHEDAPIPYIHFQETEFRVLKNGFSKRMVPIAPELIRLGFIDYIKAMRAEGEILVFPELYFPENQSGFDNAFYKKVFQRWRAACFPEGTDWYNDNGRKKEKDAQSFRGSFITLVKCNDRIRNMIVGHAGVGQSSKRYDQRTDLSEMLAALQTVSFLTRHIEARPIQLRPRYLRKNL